MKDFEWHPAGYLELVRAEVPGYQQLQEELVRATHDRPSSVADQLAWLRDAGLAARIAWAEADLAVIVAAPAVGDRA